MRKLSFCCLLVAVALTGARSAHAESRPAAAPATGALRCGVVTAAEDWNKAETHGNVSAFGVDVCKALLAATLTAPGQASLTTFPDTNEGLQALHDGRIDVLAGATPSPTNRAVYQVAFAPPLFIDGVGFLVNRHAGIAKAAELADKSVCFIASTPAEQVLDAHAGTLRFRPFPFEEMGEMEDAFERGHCDAMVGDISQLAATRAQFRSNATDFVLLPERFSLDPLAPAYRAGDAHWGLIVETTVQALLSAEADGITRARVAHDKDPAVRAWLAASRGPGRVLGLDDAWSQRMIAAVGNAGEIFDRDLGAQSPLRLPRERSALWSAGGLLYPAPWQ